MARAIINNPVVRQLNEIKILRVIFDVENLAAQVLFEFKYDDGTAAEQRVLVSQTPDVNGIRDFFLVFRTATSINDLEVKTLEFFQSQLGDVTVEA